MQKKYHVVWFNPIINSDEIIPIIAENRGEALEAALLHLINSGRKYATYDDVSNIREIDEEEYYSYAEEVEKYKSKNNGKEPDMPNKLVYIEEEDDWFIRQSDGSLTYLDGYKYDPNE